ncbi:MAG: tetratricopeptide repeat protein [Candidatus Cloacimonetes bacterium]|jgi:tetratricopeptide (TPR) repeat protein|nr:tetratricopeptide repeat protein [Candidatus Cloacimonadota bacterium]MBT6993886.1 tetratricopeptide repeat protein [Candidatus Cloacimonadota bacterium]
MKKVEAIIWKAKLCQKKNWIRAQNLLENGLNDFPNNTSLLTNLAEIYRQRKMYEKAIEKYQIIQKLNPKDDDISFQIGNCYLLLKKYHSAIESFKEVETNFDELLYNKAFCYARLKQIDTAIHLLEQLNRDNLKSVAPIVFLAELYFAQRDYNKSLEYLNDAKNKFGDREVVSYLSGLIFFRKKNYLKAYWEFQKTDKQNFSDPLFFLNYALTCKHLGKKMKAIGILMRAIKIFPNEERCYLELIKLHFEMGNKDQAIFIFEQATVLFASSFELKFLYKKILQMRD